MPKNPPAAETMTNEHYPKQTQSNPTSNDQSQFQTQNQLTQLAGREIAASSFSGCANNVKRFFADFSCWDVARMGEPLLEAVDIDSVPGLLVYTAQALPKTYLPRCGNGASVIPAKAGIQFLDCKSLLSQG